MIRVAAIADLHFSHDAVGTLRPDIEGIAEIADVLLIAGDLTRVGEPSEAQALAKELEGLSVPVISVLGNHDYHRGRQEAVTETMESRGIKVLEGDAEVLQLNGTRVAGDRSAGAES